MTEAATKPYGNPARAKVMLIGHDPRLQQSETVASYCLFADYYFRPKPSGRSEAAKYGLAASSFQLVLSLTGSSVSPEEVLLTNLCNRALPHAPRGKTVLIPRHEAERGIVELRQLLDGSTVRVILAMSQQVNYWLQKLIFCTATEEFLVEKVRELFSAVYAEHADRDILVTSGTFTKDAWSFEVGKPLVLIDGPALNALAGSSPNNKHPTPPPSPQTSPRSDRAWRFWGFGLGGGWGFRRGSARCRARLGSA